jgi:hypothetical protein
MLLMKYANVREPIAFRGWVMLVLLSTSVILDAQSATQSGKFVRQETNTAMSRSLSRLKPASTETAGPAVALAGWMYGPAYQVGLIPTAVAVGDFNNDGNLDLAVASDSGTGISGTVAVLLGNGDGTFQSQVSYTVGFTCNGVAAADLNADGRLDLVVTCSFNNTVAVLLGNGDGTFQPEVTYPTGSAPWGVAVADLDLDGKPDLAVAAASGVVSVLLGNGDGSFQPHVDYLAGINSFSLVVADFNADGKPDVAVTNEDVAAASTVSVLLGNGDGTFMPPLPYTVGSGARSLAVRDFNRDGKLDLAVANFTADTVSVLLGNGDGSFQAALTFRAGIEPSSVAVGDFNGDGIPDLVVCDAYSNDSSILLGKGDGTFTLPLSYLAGRGPTGVAVGDFNGDGRLDVAVANGADSTVSALVQSVAALSSTVLVFASQPIRTRSNAQVIALTNLGTSTMTITAIASESNEFEVQSGCPRMLLAGASCGIGVRFEPETEGAKISSLAVSDTAGGSPQKIILAGQATDR